MQRARELARLTALQLLLAVGLVAGGALAQPVSEGGACSPSLVCRAANFSSTRSGVGQCGVTLKSDVRVCWVNGAGATTSAIAYTAGSGNLDFIGGGYRFFAGGTATGALTFGTATAATTYTSLQSAGNNAFVAATGARVCLNGAPCTAYLNSSGDAFQIFGTAGAALYSNASGHIFVSPASGTGTTSFASVIAGAGANPLRVATQYGLRLEGPAAYTTTPGTSGTIGHHTLSSDTDTGNLWAGDHAYLVPAVTSWTGRRKVFPVQVGFEDGTCPVWGGPTPRSGGAAHTLACTDAAAGGSVAAGSPLVDFRAFTTADAAASASYLTSSSVNETTLSRAPRLCAKVRTPAAITSRRYWVGLASATLSGGATPAVHYCAWRYDTGAGDTKWTLCCDAASGAPTCTNTGSTTVAVSTTYVLCVEGAAVSKVVGSVNGTPLTATIGATLPTGNMGPHIAVTDLSADGTAAQLLVGGAELHTY